MDSSRSADPPRREAGSVPVPEPMPGSAPPPPPPPREPTAPEVIEPSLPGTHEPVRDPQPSGHAGGMAALSS